MTRYYGVVCQTCEVRIALGKCDSGITTTMYVPRLEPILCHVCGGSHEYRSAALIEFEAGDHLPLVA
jgi:hypothetical protein